MSAVLTRRAFAVTTLSAGFALAVQPLAAEPIATPADGLDAGEVQIPVSDGHIPGYRARPAGGTAEGVVLVTQEIFGVHEHIKDLCRRFARLGYYAIAPELYARQGNPAAYTDIKKLVDEVVAKVPDAQVLSDLDATTAFATGEKADAAKLGITGFCWGGRIVWLYAAHAANLKAGVAFYGRLVGTPNALMPKYPLDVAAELRAPVLGLYGGKDEGIPLDTIDRMKAALAAAGSPSKIEVYPEAPHGFMADYRDSYTPDVAKDAWGKMLGWFKANGVA
ncbi:MAG: dienelactone hydrolase family protein [Alphaproteobacteria bacterium]|nr:dienelactone hydrolase family protein [Alphaproteobacteria bacterium]